MKVLITGGTGMVGSAIIAPLLRRGDEVYNLTTFRHHSIPGVHSIYWNPDESCVEGNVPLVDAVIHLAGFNIACKWTPENKEKIVSSRLGSTQLLMDILGKMEVKPRVLVSTSAAGYYASSGQLLTEDTPPGSGFLSDLCVHWENATSVANDLQIRRVILRVGIVLAKDNGALKKMSPLFRVGLGSDFGNGKQYMSWIHLEDLAGMYIYAIDQPHVRGIFNACAPVPVTNHEFSRALAKALHRPAFLPGIPAFMLKRFAGEMSSMLLDSQRMHSERIRQTGFTFRFNDLPSALSDLFKK